MDRPSSNLPLCNFIGPTAFHSIGIDLTGSETRPSGWAALRGDAATTRRIRTNAELIDASTAENPQVISIDSPLSLPAGRTTPFDDDPGRAEFGITRESERLLLRRGIRSYPCLIPSMQKLTLRGMTLAAAFRGRGFAVIESFPGGAQDLLRIPRKQKSREGLLHGLQDLGIRGDYIRSRVSHDELDAITAALVGHFYLAGRYEALGNETEGYLIVPKMQ